MWDPSMFAGLAVAEMTLAGDETFAATTWDCTAYRLQI